MNKTLVKDILIAILVLGIIALAAGGLLGLVNSFTKISAEEEMARLTDKIKQTKVYEGEEALQKVDLTGFDQGFENGSIINVFKAGDAYVIHCTGDGGYSSGFEILVNITDYKIVKIAAYTHGETPGVGTRAFKEDMLSQFYQKDLNAMDKITGVKGSAKEDDQVAMVTGASKSSTALINAVNVAVGWYLNNAKGGEQ
ncbi:MAG: FMN-binding protein [Clostridia bacterium]|nr:FMN-binding protein [Clostridia bacterium]